VIQVTRFASKRDGYVIQRGVQRSEEQFYLSKCAVIDQTMFNDV
jgi:hypothetical protein